MFKSNATISRMGALLVLPALLIAHSSVTRASNVEPPSVTVNYQDLNLDDPKDIAKLYRRINSAAATVCVSAEGPQSVNRAFWNTWHDCMNRATGNAVQAVHDERLGAYYWQHDPGARHAGIEAPAVAANR
jgi:UrcA family protein